MVKNINKIPAKEIIKSGKKEPVIRVMGNMYIKSEKIFKANLLFFIYINI
jgi:hypothetical protein